MTKNKQHNENSKDPEFFKGDNKRSIYKVPSNYFESLQDAVEEKIIEEDLNALPISKHNIYNTPDEYFSSIKGTNESETAKIISINKWYNTHFAKIAASVTVILAIASLSFIYINSISNNNELTSENKDYDFEITEYETGLFDETEDVLMASLTFEENISFDNTILMIENNLSNAVEIDEYLDSEIELSIEF